MWWETFIIVILEVKLMAMKVMLSKATCSMGTIWPTMVRPPVPRYWPAATSCSFSWWVGDYLLMVTIKKERCQTPTLRWWWWEWLMMMKMMLIAMMTNNGHLKEDGDATGEHCDEVYQQKRPWDRKSTQSRLSDNYNNYKQGSQKGHMRRLTTGFPEMSYSTNLLHSCSRDMETSIRCLARQRPRYTRTENRVCSKMFPALHRRPDRQTDLDRYLRVVQYIIASNRP